MSFLTRNEPPAPVEEPAEVATGARLIPRITIQAACGIADGATGRSGVHDRRMSKSPYDTQLRARSSIETISPIPRPSSSLSNSRSPVTSRARWTPASLRGSTRLIVRASQRVVLYRELIRSGVSEYIVLRPAAVDRLGQTDFSPRCAALSVTIGSSRPGEIGQLASRTSRWAISPTSGRTCGFLDLYLASPAVATSTKNPPPALPKRSVPPKGGPGELDR